MCGIAYLELRYGGFIKRWAPGYKTSEKSLAVVALGLLRSLISLTAAFVAVTAILLSYDLLATSAVAADGKQTPVAIADGDIVRTVCRHYVWHLLDAVPSLKVPDTLNWKLRVKLTDTWSGAILLMFKVLVLVPVVRGAIELFDLMKRRRPDAVNV